MQIAVIGAGNVGGTLGRRWAQGGHRVTFAVRNPEKAEVQALLREAGENASAAGIPAAVAAAEVVVLATPWQTAAAALQSAGDLTGKVLVDCTNAIGPELQPALPAATSAAEEVAKLAPGARVVKAFNTTGFNIMADPQLGGRAAAMFYCGDDEAARGTVGQLAADLGFEPVDCGPLRNARLLESVARLWIWLAMHGGRDFAFGMLRKG